VKQDNRSPLHKLGGPRPSTISRRRNRPGKFQGHCQPTAQRQEGGRKDADLSDVSRGERHSDVLPSGEPVLWGFPPGLA
jgi:hypothetical protein